MNFLNTLSLWQWAVLLAVPPAIVALYFLKLRRQPLEVPSTFLWHKSIEDLHVNSPWQRIRQSLLLYLQLLIVALVAMALLRPGWHSSELAGGRCILLIDNSASMSATDVLPSRLEEAKRQAAALIDAMHSGDEALVISFSDTAHVEQGFTDNRRDLRQAIQNIQPANRSTNIDEALKLSAGFANPRRSAQSEDESASATQLTKLFIISDRKFPPAPSVSLGNLEPVFIPIGNPAAANLGIVAFSVQRSHDRPDQLQAFGRIENFGPQPLTVPVDLLLNGNSIDAAKLTVPAGDSAGVTFQLSRVYSGVLELRLATSDSLEQDNRAWAAINSPLRPKVLLITPGNKALETALSTPRAKELADVTIASPDVLKTKQHADAAANGTYGLIIYDRCRPERMPQANTLFIDKAPPQPELAADPTSKAAVDTQWWSLGETVTAPQIIDSARNHPLMQWIDMGNVNIAEARPVMPPPGGTRLLDSNKGVLMAIAPRDEFEDVVLGFEIYSADRQGQTYANTNWPIRSSFPTFVYAVLEYLGGGHSNLAGESLKPGQPITLKSTTALQQLEVRTPQGSIVSLPRAPNSSFHFAGTEELGPYEVLEDGKVAEQFTVNLFDPSESDIAVAEKSLQIGHVSLPAQGGYQPVRQETWKWWLAGALAVLILEWYIYNRRVYL